MSWLLDTDSCSYAMRGAHGVRERMLQKAVARVHVSSITVGEAWAGALRSDASTRWLDAWEAFLAPFAGRILAFDEEAAREYGDIRAHLEKKGRMIGDRDCMIAAIARSRGLTVVSRNLGEFRRVPRLKLESWASR